MDIILIAAVTANGMIAHHSDEVIEWSLDLALFRQQTMGHTVIMGSNTERTLATDLDGRNVIVMHRDMDPREVLKNIKDEKCYIIGGSRTYTRFAPYLTHLYLTFHPLILSSQSLHLFTALGNDIDLEFIGKIEVDGEKGVYQFQYRVKQ
ncbi:MAG: dihydrofolate reductase [Candidatus Marinimicrobia bacterium]|nr:dihydrofolate reductase [Candidatus Neomarinimicrobiota bacterium]